MGETLNVSESLLGTGKQQSDFLTLTSSQKSVCVCNNTPKEMTMHGSPPNKKGFVAAIVFTDGISGAADFHRDASALLWSAATER